MIIILSLNNLQMSLKDNLHVLENIKKSTIKKEIIEIDKDGKESVTTISYKRKFIDSGRFMARSLSSLVDNLTKGIHKIKCKDCDCFLQYERVKDNLTKYIFIMFILQERLFKQAC